MKDASHIPFTRPSYRGSACPIDTDIKEEMTCVHDS